MVPQQPGPPGPSQSGVIALPYPDRFFAAALFAGFAPSSPFEPKSSYVKLSDDSALLLYSLYQQATVGPCNIAKPWSWNVVEYAKWTSWNQLGKMPSTEAMRLFVRTLEEEDRDWMRKVQEEKVSHSDQDPEWWSKAHDAEISSSNEPAIPTPEPAQVLSTTMTDKPSSEETPTVSMSESLAASSNGTVAVNGHDITPEPEVGAREPELAKTYCWSSPLTSGRRPAARYQHAAAVVGKRMFVIGGNHNGRYLSDVQELDLDTFTWIKREQATHISSPRPNTARFPPCAGHSLIQWEDKLLTVAGHSKESSDWVTVRAFDTTSSSWSMLPTYGVAPVARGGQSVSKVGNTLVLFGGEDSKRRLCNDVHVLDLETMTWDAVDTRGDPPSARSDHAAAVHEDHFLFIFGGGSHSSCFNDLHVLDLGTMTWSQPPQQGFVPSPRAGHAAVTVGTNWYIIGGGDNKSGISDTLLLNLSTLVWQVIATEQGRTPIASEGLTVVASPSDGAATLISFGGYNGRYSNEVHILRASSSEKAKLKVFHSPAAAAAAASAAAAFAVSRSQAAPSVPLVNGDASAESGELGPSQSSSERSEEMDIQAKDTQDTAEDTSIMEIPAAEFSENDALNDPDIPSDVKLSGMALLQGELEATRNEALKANLELATAVQENSDLAKELVAVREQLAAEQSRCFRLEVDVLELRQKLQAMDSLQKELDLVRRQHVAAEEAAVNAAQRQSPGVWSWLAGHQQDQKTVEV